MIAAEHLGVEFFFDRHLRVVTRGAAKFRSHVSSTWGIRNLTFEIGRAEGVALIGPSGSGKTTLLRLLAGIYEPDEGRLDVSGRVASLLAVDSGLLPLLNGHENALLLGVLAGRPRSEALRSLEDVRKRSGLSDAWDHPVSTYSQGMKARLGLAVAEQFAPEILLLDEVHEALDHEYRDYLEQRAEAIVRRGGIVIAAGHDHPMLERLCTRAIWMEDGGIREDGAFDFVQPRYLTAVQGADRQ